MAVNSSKIALMSVWATKVLETARAPHLRQAQHRQRDLRQTQNRQRDLRQTQNRQRDLHHRPQCRRQRLVAAAAASTSLLQALGLKTNAAILLFQRIVNMGL
jgi:hypothetical protein